MAKKQARKDAVSKLESKQERQSRLIDKLKQTNRWLLWVAVIAIFLLLLCGLVMGYASNWWNNPETSDRTSQFESDAQDGSGGTASTSNRNGSSNSSSTNSSSSGSDKTTSTTKETTVTNNSNTSTDNNKKLLETFLEEIAVGDNINDTINRANELGIATDCHNTLVAVQECEFTAGDYSVTTRNLITSDSITGILDNLNP